MGHAARRLTGCFGICAKFQYSTIRERNDIKSRNRIGNQRYSTRAVSAAACRCRRPTLPPAVAAVASCRRRLRRRLPLAAAAAPFSARSVFVGRGYAATPAHPSSCTVANSSTRRQRRRHRYRHDRPAALVNKLYRPLVHYKCICFATYDALVFLLERG